MKKLSAEEKANVRVEPVYDIVNCGPRHRFWANGKLVHNSDSINVQNMNRNQLVDKTTPVGTKVFYKDAADAVVAVLDDNKVHLARAGVVENDEEELHIMGLRDAIKAPKGKKLVVLDWSQIELRFNSWLWGEVWILDTLVSGKDVYKVTAAMTYGIDYGEVNKSQRFVGKSQQLGLGYGAGKNGLIVVMGKRSEEFTEQQLQSFVNSYRQSAPNIKRGWDKCKTMLNAMVQGIDVELGDKNELFYSVGNKIMRPNGMALTYRGVHHRPGEMGNELWFWGKNKHTKKPDWEKTFGGKIVENICQAACRDIAAEKVVNLRYKFFERGFTRDDAHIVMTVHDEIIVCCKDELAEEVFDIMQDVMTHSTGWYASLPLAVDGSIAQRYGCAK